MDDRIAVALRGFGPFGILAIVVILAGNLVVDMATKAEAANQMAMAIFIGRLVTSAKPFSENDQVTPSFRVSRIRRNVAISGACGVTCSNRPSKRLEYPLALRRSSTSH